MAIFGIEFSQFNVGGTLQPTDIVVGLRNNQNYQFNAPSVVSEWVVVGANTAMTPNIGYIAAGSGTLLLTLPTIIAAGQTLRISGANVCQWQIVQNAGQFIYMGSQTTTMGPTGHLASTLETDVVELLCINVNVGFIVLSNMGNITVN